MSTYEATYCDEENDLQYIEPNINNYNLRRVIPSDWQSSGTADLYNLYSAGYVDQLFKDGEEMRGVEGSIFGFWGTDKESFLLF